MKFGKTSVSHYNLEDGDFLVTVKDIQTSNIGAKKVSVDSEWLSKSVISHNNAHKRALKWQKRLRTTSQATLPTESEKSDSDCSVPAENASRRWIADAGSGHDLLGTDDLVGDYEIKKGKHVRLKTAGGRTGTSNYVSIKIDRLGSTVNPIVLDSTPPVLSVGKRDMEQSYGFYWPPKANPYPKGKKIKLKVQGLIPYLMEYSSENDLETCALSSVSLGKQHSRKGESASPEITKSASSGTMEKYEIATEETPKLSDGSKNQIKICYILVASHDSLSQESSL